MRHGQIIRLVVLLLAAGCVDAPPEDAGHAPEHVREFPRDAVAKPRPSRKDLLEKHEDAEAAKPETFEKNDPSLARVGVASTKVFHRPSCPLLKDVPSGEQLRFTSPWEGLDAGYRPCDECRSAPR